MNVDICVHDQPRYQVYCINNITQNESTLPIEDTDKYIMLSPESWGQILEKLRRAKRLPPDVKGIIKANEKMVK